jgi:two-component system, OmpR family, sensor histidine kinase KdpD
MDPTQDVARAPDGAGTAPAPARTVARARAGIEALGARRTPAAWAYTGTVLIVAACTLLAALLERHVELSNVEMVLVAGVVLSAVAFGRGPAVVAALLSVAVFDFGFVPPRFTLRVSDTQYLVLLAVMLLVAITTGTLTGWLREQRERAEQRERQTAALARLSHDLAFARTEEDVLRAASARIDALLGSEVAVLVPDREGAVRVVLGDPALFGGGEEERGIAQWACERGEVAGLEGQRFHAPRALHVPLRVAVKVLGVLAVRNPEPPARPTDRLHLLRAMASQTALAVERCRLADEAQEARTQAETERARSVLLSSVSHDLRTPLATITGAASSLRDGGTGLTEATRAELAEDIYEQAERLNRLIGNLLDMTRLESGALRVRKEWHSPEEVIGAALVRLESVLGDREVKVLLPEGLPLVPLDDVLFEQVVWNLVENAHKHAPAGSPLEIAAEIRDGALRVTVADRGPGLAPGEEQRVFEKFYRGGSPSARPGFGLGLAICQGIVAAHGGRIEAANRAGGGAVFTVLLPLEGEPPALADEPPTAEGEPRPAAGAGAEGAS